MDALVHLFEVGAKVFILWDSVELCIVIIRLIVACMD